MHQVLLALFVVGIVALSACGQGESSSRGPVPGDAKSPPPAEAEAAAPRQALPAEAAAPRQALPAEIPPIEELGLSPAAQTCLALVDDAKFDQAVVTCSRALQQDPSDTQLQKILDLAKSYQKAMDSMDREAQGQAADDARRALSDPGR